jgi:chorismate dehydratase
VIKVGVINYVNANPLFYALKAKKVPCSAELTHGNPLQINDLLHKGELDIALISSAEFLAHRSKYVLLSDLGVASTGAILSVRLFYKNDPLSLDRMTVLIPLISTTSVRLLTCLSKNFWKVRPLFQPYTCPIENLFEQHLPFLLIGDDCLKHVNRKDISSLDLGEAWHNATNKSLIYSLVSTRVDFFRKNPDKVVTFHNELEESFKWARTHEEEVIESSLLSCPCSKDTLLKYFRTLEHRLTSKHFQGLNYYSKLEV